VGFDTWANQRSPRWDAAVTVKQAYATFCSRRHLKESRNRTNEERI